MWRRCYLVVIRNFSVMKSHEYIFVSIWCNKTQTILLFDCLTYVEGRGDDETYLFVRILIKAFCSILYGILFTHIRRYLHLLVYYDRTLKQETLLSSDTFAFL